MFYDLNVKKIPVAIDGSDNSIKAANYSLFLGDKFKAIVIALYVIPQKGKNAEEAIQDIQHILEKIKLDASLNHVELKTEIIQSESSVINEIRNMRRIQMPIF